MAKAKTSVPGLRDALHAGLTKHFEKTDVTIGTADEVGYLAAVKFWVPTGIFPLDLLLSRGRGLPCGRFLEFFGPESAGKTALCEYLSAMYLQTYASNPHWADYEKSYDEDHMRGYGVRPKDVFTPDLPTLENGWDYIGTTLDLLAARRSELEKAKQPEDPPVLFVVDSIAAATPRAELEEESADNKHMAETARAMSKGFRKYLRRVSDAKATVIFTNQIRDKMNARPGQKQTETPGGRAVRFGCSTRLELVKAESIQGKGDVHVGHICKVQSVKNRLAPQRMQCQLVVSYSRGIDPVWTNFMWFKEHGTISAAGTAGYRWKGIEAPFKRLEFAAWCNDHAEVVAKERDRLYAKILVAYDTAPATDLEDEDDDDAPSQES